MSDIRGPTSALTSFLRDKNIRIPNTNRFRRRDAAEAAARTAEVEAAAGGASQATRDTLDGAVAALQAEAQGGSSPSGPSGSGPSSSSADANKRKAPATSSPFKSPPTKKGKAKKGLSMNFDEEDDDEEEDEDDEDFTVSQNEMEGEDNEEQYVPRGGSRRRATQAADPSGASEEAPPPPGNDGEVSKWVRIREGVQEGPSRKLLLSGAVDNCAGCSRRFSITGYTVQTASGGLCHRCGPEYTTWLSLGVGERTARTAGPSSTSKTSVSSEYFPPKPAAPRKKKTTVVKPQDKKELPSLQSMCINIISEYIEDVEALGGIGRQSIDALSKSISKNRRLNPQTVQLFLEPDITSLSLYDCSKLDSDSLESIATFSPLLHAINLQLCGRLTNEALDAWSSKMRGLRHVELYGPYLVRVEAWHRFFERLGERLETFKIRESPRFDLSCVEKMVEHCPNIAELGLAQIGPLDGKALKPLYSFRNLRYIDVSDPGVSGPGIPAESLKDDDLIELLSHIGSGLEVLNVGGNADLTDRFILEGILYHCRNLRELNLHHCERIEGDALTLLFDVFSARGDPGLEKLVLRRCVNMSDDALGAIVEHSGHTLRELDLNSCDKLTQEGLKLIAPSSTMPPISGEREEAGCPSLNKLDLGFVRATDDGLITTLVDGVKKLEEVKVFGDNKLSDVIVSTPRCRIIGLEKQALIAKNVN